MTQHESVSDWISSLKRGSGDAAQKIWQRYYQELVRMTQRRLGHLRRQAADEEDIAQEAFACFFSAVEAGRFPQLEDRDDLWKILLMLVDRRAKDRIRKELAEKRGAGDVRGESALTGGQSSTGAPGLWKD